MSYKTIQLSKAADIIVGFPFASEKFNINAQGTRLVRGKNITTGNLRWGDDTRWWDDSSIDLSKYMLKADDIVIGMDGSLVGKNYAKISENDLPLLLVQRVACIRAKEGYDQRFLWGCIASGKFERYIDSIKTGTSIPHISGGQIGNYLIPDFDLPTQKKIAAILSALDEKIAINREINENLERQAQAVFMNMFAESKTTVPATIADVALNVTDGVHNTVYDDPEGKFLLLSCKNIKNGTLSIGSTERRISFDTFEKLRRRTKLSKGDVLISSVGTVGELLLLNKDPSSYEFQRSVAMVKPNPDIVSPAYLYESLVFKKAELINAAHGAVQQCLFISDIAGFPIGIPKPDELCDFDTIVTPLFDIISANETENQRLSELRDTLLPKLMSGDLDVSNLML